MQGPKPIKIPEHKPPTDEWGFPLGYIRAETYRSQPADTSRTSKTPRAAELSTVFVTELDRRRPFARPKSAPPTPSAPKQTDRLAATASVYKTAMLPLITRLATPPASASAARKKPAVRAEDLLAWRNRTSPPKQRSPYDPPKRPVTASPPKSHSANAQSKQKQSQPKAAPSEKSADKPDFRHADSVVITKLRNEHSKDSAVADVEPRQSNEFNRERSVSFDDEGLDDLDNDVLATEDEDLVDVANRMHNFLAADVDAELRTPPPPEFDDDNDGLLDGLDDGDASPADNDAAGLDGMDLDLDADAADTPAPDGTASSGDASTPAAEAAESQPGGDDGLQLNDLDDAAESGPPKPAEPLSWTAQRDLLLQKAERWQTIAKS